MIQGVSSSLNCSAYMLYVMIIDYIVFQIVMLQQIL